MLTPKRYQITTDTGRVFYLYARTKWGARRKFLRWVKNNEPFSIV